jgi:hypothetical protein
MYQKPVWGPWPQSWHGSQASQVNYFCVAEDQRGDTKQLSMLKADQVELGMLTLVLNHSDTYGPTFQLPQLEQTLSRSIGPTSQREIVEALLLLFDDSFVGLGRYAGRTFVPYDRREGSEYFYYGGGFRCTALPKARRRHQELSKENRHGIFISHISEERPIALRIQQLFAEALSESLPVFVSSDYKSIESGDPWYSAILEGLHKSEAVVTLLSPFRLIAGGLILKPGSAWDRGHKSYQWCGVVWRRAILACHWDISKLVISMKRLISKHYFRVSLRSAIRNSIRLPFQIFYSRFLSSQNQCRARAFLPPSLERSGVSDWQSRILVPAWWSWSKPRYSFRKP